MHKRTLFYIIFITLYCSKGYSQNNTTIPKFMRDSSIIADYKNRYFNNSNSIIYVYKLGNGFENLMMMSYEDTSIKKGLVIKHSVLSDANAINTNIIDSINRISHYNALNYLTKCIDTLEITCCDIPIFLMVITNKVNEVIYSGYFMKSKEYSCRDCFVLIDRIKSLLK